MVVNRKLYKIKRNLTLHDMIANKNLMDIGPHSSALVTQAKSCQIYSLS